MPSGPSQQQLRLPAQNMHGRLACRKAIPDNHPALSILVRNSLHQQNGKFSYQTYVT
jgi:hypothetical protein